MGTSTPGGDDASGPEADADPVAAAIHTLLAGGPNARAALHPGLVADINDEGGAEEDAENLDDLLDDAAKLLGPLLRVATTADHGLVAEGRHGRVQVWGAVGADGRLTGLLIGDERLPAPVDDTGPVRRRIPPYLRRPGKLFWTVVPLLIAGPCWWVDTGASWLAAPAPFAVMMGSSYGFGSVRATLNRAEIWLGRAALLSVLASAWRLTYLPFGHFGWDDAGVPLILALLLASVVRSRLHDWNLRLSQPLRFPLTGTWYVAQGGGRLTNHHVPYVEQRGAVDLVRIGPNGRTKREGDDSVTAYAAYGSPLYAPCAGVVARAQDGLPDAAPGRPRFGPPEGNHVRIDTGHETVVLAHLRPGSLRVSPGDRVRPGQLLAEIGNSGNTTEPHLHLHAERGGEGLDLRFTELGNRRLWRGRRITVTPGDRP